MIITEAAMMMIMNTLSLPFVIQSFNPKIRQFAFSKSRSIRILNLDKIAKKYLTSTVNLPWKPSTNKSNCE